MNSKHFIFGASVVAGLGLYSVDFSVRGFDGLRSEETTFYDALRVDALTRGTTLTDIAFMPNGTCQIPDMSTIDVANYKDYVRACLNNRRLRYQVN
tara:strand:+ start:1403 stop:1690 length:288 start_codon:yes stop_codon:yes gene_type:complete